MSNPLTGPAGRVVLVDPTTGLPYAATGVAGGPAVTIANGADATQGAKADAAVVDPSATASVVALLKGILTALNTIAVNTTPP